MVSQNIRLLIDDGKLEEALSALTAWLAERPDDDEALFARGRVLWKLGRRHEAMSDYASASSLNPDSPASIALQQAREVFAFYNRDLYNP